MKQAIIDLNNKQHMVTEGEELLVDKLMDEKPAAEVLFFSDGDEIKVGTPVLSDVNVKLEVLDPEVKGEKIQVKKFRAKSRYRRKIGFRPVYSRIRIKSIS